jgi:hypothetical protein
MTVSTLGGSDYSEGWDLSCWSYADLMKELPIKPDEDWIGSDCCYVKLYMLPFLLCNGKPSLPIILLFALLFIMTGLSPTVSVFVLFLYYTDIGINYSSTTGFICFFVFTSSSFLFKTLIDSITRSTKLSLPLINDWGTSDNWDLLLLLLCNSRSCYLITGYY